MIPGPQPSQSLAGHRWLPLVGRAVGSRGGISCKLSQGPPITPSSLQLSLVWIHLHNLVQYLLSQPHFLGCLHGRQLGRLQLQHYRHAGKPRQAHTERQLPNKHSPRGAPAWVYPRPCSWSSAGPHLQAGLSPDAGNSHNSSSRNKSCSFLLS